MRKRFSGFPARARSTPLADLFFAEVLPPMQDLVELKAVLHIAWRLFRKNGYPRYVSLRELKADPVLLASLGQGPDAVLRLQGALAQATERGVLLRLRLDRGGRQEELYLLNDAAGRRAMEVLQERGAGAGFALLPEEPSQERPNIFSFYENTFGFTISPHIVAELEEAEAQYPQEWIEEAFREAAELNKRSWRYVRRILERWASEGKNSGTPGRPDQTTVGRYVQGRRGPLVPWR